MAATVCRVACRGEVVEEVMTTKALGKLGVVVQNPTGNPKPPLVPLHADSSLIHSKLAKYGKLSNQELIDSLKPGQQGSLKVRPDGTRTSP
jgi:hypothetical protein